MVVQIPITEEMVNISPTATLEETVIPTTEITTSPTPMESVEALEQVTEKPTQKLTGNPTHTHKPTIAPTPIATEKPTAVSTPATTPKPTPKPTQAPEFTVICGQIRSGALQGINEARDEEGNTTAQLDSGLNSQAEAHAITMAKADKLFHSSMGHVESVRSGA